MLSFSALVFFSCGIAPSWQGVLGHVCLAYPCNSSAYILVRLLGASLTYPVIRGCLFAGASLEHLRCFRFYDWISRSDVLSYSHLLLFGGQLLLILLFLSVGVGEEIKV